MSDDKKMEEEIKQETTKNTEDTQQETKEIDYKDLYLRALAEQKNLSNKHQKDLSEAISFANKRLIADLIPLLDTFQLALTHQKDEQDASGIKMLQDQFLTLLKRYGVIEINPKAGDKFDPYQHEALKTAASEELPDNSIHSVAQSGYMLHDRILRAARVTVVKNEQNEK